ncbi:uncharacterized protein K02A2.6-like [Teleopsis dalmanni]|uniref:uncharacterized protein K02A2.6-like n=1 Tax=Teleopsis dalmanni TaxID=139649 RepID=UPI0018CD89F5|nr:uncharacterized protein K02A2.6-like [Teleopsis dalmanni]
MASRCLQRLAYATTILSYDFSIEYINTDSFGYADIISRLIANHVKPDEDTVIASIQLEEDEDLKINCFTVETATKLPITFTTIQTATKAYHTLNKVTFYSQNDCWPQKKKQITDNEVAAFFQHRHHLTIQQQSIFFGERIVIPKIYHQQVLEDLHNGHPGECRMKFLAATKVFWPNINLDIKHVVKTCDTCAIASKSPMKCTPQQWKIPSAPWKRIHIDYAGPIDSNYFLVIIDAFSK